MSDEDKPFVCSQPGCNMRFTNEDHLAVHVRKHDMSLALNLTQGTLSPLGLFTDQTPTPTKFLKNCEELGLFQELSKNPFDDSFKKAMDDPLDHVDNSLHLPNPDSSDLDTPQPPVPRIMVGGEELRENKKFHDKSKTLTASSIVPKKRKFLSQNIPTSTTSEDDEEAVIGSSTELTGSTQNTDTESVLIEDGSEPVQPAKRAKVQMSEKSPQTEMEQYYTATRVQVEDSPQKNPNPVQSAPSVAVNSIPVQSSPTAAAGPVMVQVLLQLPGGQVVPVQVPASNIAGGQPVASKPITQGIQLLSPPISHTQPTILTQNSQQAVIMTGNTVPQTRQNIQTVTQSGIIQNTVPIAVKPQQNTTSPQTGLQTFLNQNASQQTLQTILNQSAGSQPIVFNHQVGGTKPVMQTILGQTGTQPAVQVLNQSNVQSALRTILVANKQAGLQTVVSQNNATQLLQNAITLSNTKTANKTTALSNQSYAKQRLKAAIQQQLTPSNAQKQFQSGEIKVEPQWSPGSAGSSANVSSPETSTSVRYAASVDNIPDMVGDSPDTECKREKFLERNRAAAARCRQKRKQWVQTLENKADELSSLNNKLCSEIKKLRGEVANLKTMLLAHKDCPVTIQQRSQGQISSDLLEFDDPNDITPIIIDEINSEQTVPEIPTGSNHLSTISTVNQSPAMTSLPVPVALVSNLQNDQLVLKPVSVITGANSLGLIPKIINFDSNNHGNHGGS